MLKRLNILQLNVIVALVLLCTTFLGYFYVDDAFIASAMWPTAGFAVGLYYVHGKKALPGLIIGILIANLIARFFLIDETIFMKISYSIVFTFANVTQAYIFKKSIPPIATFGTQAVINGIKLLVLSLSVSMIGAIISVSYIHLTNNFTDFLTTFIRWSFGDFSGILIFGTVIVFSYFYDSQFIKSKLNMTLSVLYVFLFAIFSYFIFNGAYGSVSLYEFSFIFMIFFFLASFFFSYRMILTINCIYVLMYHILLINTPDPGNFGVSIFSLNLYLFVLSSIALITKLVLHNLDNRNIELRDSNKRLEDLMDSTNSLLKLSDDLLKPESSMGEEYIKKMFTIATRIFDNYDTASCYIRGIDTVEYVDAIGYDIDILNSYEWAVEEFYWDMKTPMHVVNAEVYIKKHSEKAYEDYSKRYAKILESIRIAIYIEEDIIGAISFDIIEGSEKKFNKYHYESFKSFQNLMNSFYEINYLNFKNNSLKNDIVLSLIRTLELYDQYTGGHSEEVAYLSGQIAERMGLSEKEIYDVFWAGIVHDIGKVGIKSDIINKPEKLSLEEYNQVKDHPVFGYQILKKSEDLKNIALLVKHHHEWWNGAGYPDELKKNEIPLGSQILGVCDSVSSMATKRPYTIKKSSVEIIKELKLYMGIQFSPRPAKEMIKFIREGLLDKYYEDK